MKDQSKPTPGPWTYQENSDAYTHIVRGPTNQLIAQLAQDTSGVAEANARLMASAPDLLAALNGFLALIENGSLKRDTSNDANPDWAMRMLPFVKALRAALEAKQKAAPNDKAIANAEVKHARS